MWSRRAALAAAASLAAAGLVFAQSELPRIDRFTATTTGMTPADIELRIDVRVWSDEAGRSAVVAALAAESDDADALRGLQTTGSVLSISTGGGSGVTLV